MIRIRRRPEEVRAALPLLLAEMPRHLEISLGHQLRRLQNILAAHRSTQVDVFPDQRIRLLVRPRNLHAVRSLDLQTWSTENVVALGDKLDPLTCLVYRTFRSTVPLGDLPREFLRLEIEITAP